MLCAAVLTFLLGTGSAEAALNSARYDNARPDGFAVLEIMPRSGDVRGDRPEIPEPPRRFVPLKLTRVTGVVAGPLAFLTQTQTYRFSRSDFKGALAATYRFPLPGDGAISEVKVRFGDVEIRATLKERQIAEKEYEKALQEGKQAALLTREAPDVFSLSVAGIRPDEDVTVETRFSLLARPEGNRLSLRIPLTTVPRYVRGDERLSRAPQAQPLMVLRDPGHRFFLDLILRGAEDPESPTHDLALSKLPDGSVRVALAKGEVLPDRDWVLTWRPRSAAGRPALTVFLAPGEKGESLFLAQVAPPGPNPGKRKEPEVSREAILLVDHSGSMTGPKWAAADWAAERFIRSLNPTDRFNLCLFHSNTRWYAARPVKATPLEVAQAVRFLRENRDNGGTELGVALEQALTQVRSRGNLSRHVLLITDAQVTDEGRILRLAEEEFARPDRRRIDLLCIDAAPNSFLARRTAELGGGTARFLTSSPEEEDIAGALEGVLADWSAPALTGVRLEAQGALFSTERRNLSAPSGRGALDLGDLPADRPIWVVGRCSPPAAKGIEPDGGGTPRFVLTASGLSAPVPAKLLTASPEEAKAVRALYGAGRILGLEFLVGSGRQGKDLDKALTALGYDPSEIPSGGASLYPENARKEAEARLKSLLVRESLLYGVPSSETAFVAVRREKGDPVERTVPVGNALAAGWDEAFLSRGGANSYAGGAPGGARMSRMRPVAPLADSSAAVLPSSPKGYDEGARSGEVRLFSGVPVLRGGGSVLFDSAETKRSGLPDRSVTLKKLSVSLSGIAPAKTAGMTLELYLDDPVTPRVRVSLADLTAQGGTRPLNIAWRPGSSLRLILKGPGAAALEKLSLTVTLFW
jgi:Ca-activated chloride channel family protein